MADETNHRLLLSSRPEGRVSLENFDQDEQPVPEPEEGEAILKTLYLSLDPTNRIWMAGDSYLPAVEKGAVMRGLGLGQVVASNSEDYAVGDLAVGGPGWQEYASTKDAEMPWNVLPRELPVDLPVMLGAGGMTGMTAYWGMTDVGGAQEGDTVLVTAAAGAVGSVAGQIGKALGCRVVGTAGTEEKCAWLTGELGLDEAVCYKADDWREQLSDACSDGIDVLFENVGGELFDHALTLLNLRARVALCGLIAGYNDPDAAPGPRNLHELIFKRASIQGFLVLDYGDRTGEALEQMLPWLADGKIRHEETIVDGELADAPETLNMLFDGSNRGKLLLHLADPPLDVPRA